MSGSGLVRWINEPCPQTQAGQRVLGQRPNGWRRLAVELLAVGDVVTLAGQLLGDVIADEARAAGDEYAHYRLLVRCRLRSYRR